MIHADYLFLLTDVDGLYTANPRKDPNAKLIEEAESVAAIRDKGERSLSYPTLLMIFKFGAVSTTTLGSNLGIGGMETKLIAADIATAAGVTTIITSSKHPENIFSVIEYHQRNSAKGFSEPSTPPEPISGRASPTVTVPKFDANSAQVGGASGHVSPVVPRPPHTVFKASPTPLRDLKSWTSHTLFPSGSVIIDAGAHLVLSRRESGGRLLAAGVRGVLGAFASGQAVRICIAQDDSIPTMSQEAAREKYAKGLGLTRPGTPTTTSSEMASTQVMMGEEAVLDYTEADLIEVGRGLASYNSAQIARVKGLNRWVRSKPSLTCSNGLCSSLLTQVLGYADSEYVVENITIRVPPS
jgi:glutamate 5-kinase